MVRLNDWNVLNQSFLPVFGVEEIGDISNGCCWNPWTMMRVKFFAWEATYEKILTSDQLKRRGLSFGNRCCICVNGKKNLLITSSYIVHQQVFCGS